MTRAGGSRIKKGRMSIMTDIEATLQILDECIFVDRYMPKEDPPLEDPKLPIYLDVRHAKNPQTKGGMIVYRIAASPGWHMQFHLMWDKTVVGRTLMEAALRDAGMFVGIGNARKIGMGRFRVLSFETKPYEMPMDKAA
jgi:hypothetical protein